MIGHHLANLANETQNKYSVSVSEIDASLIFDTKFTNFSIYSEGRQIFHVPKLNVSFSLFSLLSESTTLNFTALYKSGEIAGKIVFNIANSQIKLESVDLTLKKITLAELEFLTNYMATSKYPVNFTGTIDGSVYASLDKDARSSEADINLKIRNVKTEAIPVKAMNQNIPALELTDARSFIEINMMLENSKLTITNIAFPGPDLKLNITGNARIDREYRIVRMDIDGKFSFSDQIAKNFPLITLLEPFKSPDGSYPLSMKGSGTRPKIQIGEMNLSDMLNPQPDLINQPADE